MNYRESYGMYACNGILFNHESPMRGETFVTRKITRALARIKVGLQERLYLGNLDSLRDWGHARDYVEMQWMMLQQEEARDYVIATGEQYSVRDFVSLAGEFLGIHLRLGGDWSGRDGPRRATAKSLLLLIPGISVRQKWQLCWETLPRPAGNWDGRQKQISAPL